MSNPPNKPASPINFPGKKPGRDASPFEFITKRPLWANLAAAIGLVLVVLFLFFTSLGWITRHNEYHKVPSVEGKSAEEAAQILKAEGFTVKIADSVYSDTAARLSVIRQSPEPDAVVKSHRTIYLTINRALAPLVEMPDLRGFSYLSAVQYLQTLGLRVGDTTYVEDIAKNAVRQQTVHGQPIEPGTKINMGTVIDLVLGSGQGSTQVNVPDLIGMTVQQARDYIGNLNVSISTIIAEQPVTDTAASFITKQNPAPFTVNPDGTKVANRIKAGQLIDIWIGTTQPVRDTSVVAPAPGN